MPIARIVLNLPEKANIQTAQQVWDFEDALKWADRDEEVKVLIVKANGNGFCAGHAIVDPEEMPEVYPTTGPTPERTWKKHNYDLFLWPPLNLWEFSKATIAQVHGYCVGGGTVYGYLCDLTVASDDAYFQMPLPQGFGLPGAQTMIEPWALMNWKRAYEYLYLAPTLSAEEAHQWGLVNRVVPRADLESTVEEMAATIAQMPLTTIMTVKAGRQAGLGDHGHAGPPAEHRRLHVDCQRRHRRTGVHGQARRTRFPARWPRSRPRRPGTRSRRAEPDRCGEAGASRGGAVGMEIDEEGGRRDHAFRDVRHHDGRVTAVKRQAMADDNFVDLILRLRYGSERGRTSVY